MLDTIDGKGELTHLSHFHPSHAYEIARAFRRKERVWSEGTRQEIVGRVERFQQVLARVDLIPLFPGG